ncbi:MAG: hypothetical protein RIR39_1379 [Pseudomonadota bacterium]|jgi:hypothetical protein
MNNHTVNSLKLSTALSFLFILTTYAEAHPVGYQDNKQEDILLVWAGDKVHKAPDFVTVVDFNLTP